MADAPPILAMVPKTFASPSLLEMLTFSSLRRKVKVQEMFLLSKRKRRKFNVESQCYPRAEAMTKVIAGTEFCIAEAKAGDA